MSRQRADYPGAEHHVVNRGTAHTMIFRAPEDRRTFLALVAELEERFDVRVLAYVLMGNHYHLLLQSGSGRLSEAMQYLDGRYAVLFNRRHERQGALFQGRFRSERIESEQQRYRTGIYIHLNPLRAGLVAEVTAWRWSSLSAHAAGRATVTWLHLDLLGSRSGDEYLADVVASAPEVCALVGDPDPADIAWTHPGSDQAMLSETDRAVAAEFETTVDELYALVPGRRNTPRLMAIVLAQQTSDLPAAAVATRYGLAAASSVYTARRRLRVAVSTDARVARHARHLGVVL